MNEAEFDKEIQRRMDQEREIIKYREESARQIQKELNEIQAQNSGNKIKKNLSQENLKVEN